jgi:hypothetical protein
MSQIEQWVYVKNGQLMLHTENDGYAFMKHGAEAEDQPVTLETLKGNSRLHKQAVELLFANKVYNWITALGIAALDIPDTSIICEVARRLRVMAENIEEEAQRRSEGN